MRYIPFASNSVEAWMQIVAREVNALIQEKSNVLTKTAAYTIEEDDDVILGDATAAAFTVTLPKATLFEGRRFTVKKIDASVNAVTLDGDGSETIDGALTVALAVQYEALEVLSNGTGWVIV